MRWIATLLAALSLLILPAVGAEAGGQRAQLEAVLKELQAMKTEMAKRDREMAQLAREQEALKRALAQKDREIARLKAAVEGKVPAGKGAAVAAASANSPKVSFHGQYRINGYAVHGDRGDSHPTAARMRVRQDIDLAFTDRFSTHLELELGHTNSNLTTTDKDLKVRHVVLAYRFSPGVEAKAGILPLSDRFGDALYSSDWDYNPLALELISRVGPGRMRAFVAALDEGDEALAHDDFDHYELDYDLDTGPIHWSASALLLEVAAPSLGHQRPHVNYGLSARLALAGWDLTAALMGSYTSGALLGTGDDGQGAAAVLEAVGPLGPGRLGVKATYASGEEDGSGFLPVMALAKTYGYWGYTGILTVQGPTDTGFDGDAVNISNNGRGLASIQARYTVALLPRLDLYLAGGWFGGSSTGPGRSGEVGLDSMAMLTYHFNRYLALDLGADYAKVKDGAMGYGNGLLGGGYNSPRGHDRDKAALFTRLQAEF